jgi:hypothetical protein
MRFALAVLLASVTAVLSSATSARAQSADSLRADSLTVAPITEVQVALDQRGGVLLVDRALASRLGVFVDRYPRFREARLFLDSDSSYVLEVMSAPEEPGAPRDARVRRRVPLTSEEVQALRARITAGLEQHAPERLVDQEGRPWLVTGLSILGIGWYGWSIPVATDMQDNSAIAAYMLVSSTSFIVPFLITTRATVTEADADLALYGATRGIIHGYFVNDLVGNEDWDVAPAIGTAMSLGECAIFYAWSRAGNLDAGTTGMMGVLSDYMTWSAYGLAYVSEDQSHDDESTRSAAALGGAGAGLIAGQVLGRGRGLSRGDAGVIRAVSFVGAYAGAAVGELAGEESDPVIVGAIAGSGAGIAIGSAMVRGHEFTTGQSRLAVLGAVAGGLFGLGAAYSIDSEGESALQVSAIGSALGLLAVYSQLEERAEDFAFVPAARPRDTRFGLAFHPEGLVAARRPDSDGRASSLVTASWRFGEEH